VLYQVLQEHLETFLERVELDGRNLPRFVVRELRGFLRCGIRAHGFVRVRCPKCRHEFGVAFSCKGRGWCPSCGGRFMAQTAAHLVEHVLPEGVGYRQWVLTLPWDLRYRVAYDAKLCSAILRLFVRKLSAWHLDRATAQGVESAQWGAVTVVQRFGSAMQLMPHFHTVGFDGVLSVPKGADSALVQQLAAPTDDEIGRLVEEVHARLRRLLQRRGLLPDEHAAASEEDALASEEPALATCYATALRAPRKLDVGLWTVPSEAKASCSKPLCARFGGLDLHAGVSVAASDRQGLERLCRYLCRPPVSHDRLEQLDDEHVGLRLKTPYSDGTTHLVLHAHEFLQRLCALVPRPGTHRVHYHGLLAPAARDRRRVVPAPQLVDDGPSDGEEEEAIAVDIEDDERRRRPTVRKLLWAALLQRVFGIDALRCPKCDGRMRVIATIIEAKVVKAILDALGLESAPPSIRSSRGPPEQEMVEYEW